MKKLSVFSKMKKCLVIMLGSVSSILITTSYSVADTPEASDYSAIPPMLTEGAAPLIMLALSNDHQLFYKAFTDYDDLGGPDGVPDGISETTYTHYIKYVGYFDSSKCYVYRDVSGKDRAFVPSESANAETNYCDDSENNLWSGNFLNWATMTRMDQVRKVLYGGYRYRDPAVSTDETILERSHLPPDAHSFAKYYNGADLPKLTPFGDSTYVPYGLSNTSDTGITLCSTTVDSDTSTNNSSSLNSPPLVRVVAGNFSLWAANERWQCLYQGEEHSNDVNVSVEGKNANVFSKTGMYAKGDSPDGTGSVTDKARQRDGNTVGAYIVRVVVCDPSLIGDEDCRQYPSGNLKPIGILQNFGDSGNVQFGLMTGSYLKNKSGGVLRKDVSSFANEVNVSTTGTFTSVTNGIVKTIDLFRIANYDYGDGKYNDTDSCPWGESSFDNGECLNWGNPLSEIMLECYRYFAGQRGEEDFDANDGNVITGLTRVNRNSWNAPLNSGNFCAKLNVIGFNASSSSYDADELDGILDLNISSREDGLTTAKLITDLVGDGEGITGVSFFVGETAGDTNQQCTAKTIANLGDVRGTCPDSPRLSGSYQVAGLAYHAKTHDMRSDLEDSQTVKTFGVTLSPGVPNVVIPVPGDATGKVVTVLPACRSRMYNGIYGACGLVDFKIVKNYVEDPSNPGTYEGSFYVNWEDTEQGGDYDMDLYGMIKYRITSSSITITTEVVHQSTDKPMGFGFVIGGTDNDGFNVLSGIRNKRWNENFHREYKEFDCDKSGGCRIGDGPESKSFSIGSSSASLLKQPLFYAAKWGGFKDVNNDGIPNNDLHEEWDTKINATGAYGSDDIPDNYFEATNPDQLKSQLSQILISILERTAAGTSAAVVTNSGSGEGALYQALYNPRYSAFKEEDSDVEDYVSWVGTLNALFIDRYGNLREDSATPYGALTDDDYVIDIYYDPLNEETLVQRYDLSSVGTPVENSEAPVSLRNIKPIWSAGEMLAAVENYTEQRDYPETALTGRYIFTGIDMTDDGQITSSETVPFTAEQFILSAGDVEYYRLLGLKEGGSPADAKAKAENIVNYIRGNEISGFRDRMVDSDGDGVEEAFLLGDVTNSSPHPVERPSAGYDLAFGDDTYRAFRQQYRKRREVVYIGANDGMLHAFNAGFFDSQARSYDIRPKRTITSSPAVTVSVNTGDENVTQTVTKEVIVNDTEVITVIVTVTVTKVGEEEVTETRTEIVTETITDTGLLTETEVATHNSETGTTATAPIDTDIKIFHPLGSELWAYIPYNILPHLQWLTDPDYPHVYYVDGQIKHYDVNIFPDDDVHPGGWGTILVVGMRFGGGEYTLDPRDDNDGDASDDITLRSSYVIMDITDPETPPVLLAEITDVNGGMGYTVAEPTLVKMREAGVSGSYEDPSVNEWYLVFGSGPVGPESLSKAFSDAPAKLFVYDLKDKAMLNPITAGSSNSFIGGLTTADWSRDYVDDSIYFGTVSSAIGDVDLNKDGTLDSDDYIDTDNDGSVDGFKREVISTGALKRMAVGFSSSTLSTTVSSVLNVSDKAFSATPLTFRDRQGDYWVFSGTGRFYVAEDNFSTAVESYYGVKEPQTSGEITEDTVSTTDLIDTTGVKVYLDGTIANPDTPDARLATATTFDHVYDAVQEEKGWTFDFTRKRSRNFTKALVSDLSLIFSEYQPSGLQCEPLGEGYLNAPHLQAGIPGVFAPLSVRYTTTDENGDTVSTTNSDGSPEVIGSSHVGQGSPAAPTVYQRADGTKVAVLELSTGAIEQPVIYSADTQSSRQSWREVIIDW